MYIEDLMGCGEEDGLFYTTHDSSEIDFNGYNITLDNLYQSGKSDTSIMYIENNNHATLNR